MPVIKHQDINLVSGISEGLYQQNKEKGIEQVPRLLGELLEFMKEVGAKDSSCLDIQKMNYVLLEAMNALEARDYVLLADILVYDLQKLLLN